MIDIALCRICKEYLGDYAVHTQYYRLIEYNKKLSELGQFICHKCAIKESNVDKLYHISNNCEMIVEFIPRIPSNKRNDEDDITLRISLSSTIEGCLTATPWGGSKLENLFWKEDSSFLLRVYEFDVCDLDLDNTIPPEFLYSEDLVRDAQITKEHWYINNNLKPNRSYLIEVNNYLDRAFDDIRCGQLVNGLLIEKELEDDNFDWEDIIEGSFVGIESVSYSVIPEDKRSGAFQLNHEVIDIALEDKKEFESDISYMYPSINTKVALEKRNNKLYVVGEIDTIYQGNYRYKGEVNKGKMVDFLNENLSKGKILERMI